MRITSVGRLHRMNPAILVLPFMATSSWSQESPALRGWAAMSDDARKRPDLAQSLDTVVERARKIAATPVVKRVHSYADIGKDRTWLDGRA